MEKDVVRLVDLIDQVQSRSPGQDALERLSEAVLVSSHMAELADRLVGHFVDCARQAGASWSEIGQSLGVSKQAAQKRFVAWPSVRARRSTHGLSDRLTGPARRVAEGAQEQAHRGHHDEVGTVHLVLGLVREPQAMAARAIEAQGVGLDQVREAASTALAALECGRSPASDHVPFGPGAKKVLELAVREAVRLGHSYVGTQHILLGLLRNDGAAGARILAGLGVTRDRSEDWILTQSPETEP